MLQIRTGIIVAGVGVGLMAAGSVQAHFQHHTAPTKATVLKKLPTPTPSASVLPSPSETPVATVVPTPVTRKAVPKVIHIPTATPTPDTSKGPVVLPTPLATPLATPSATPEATPEATPLPSPSSTPEPTATPIPMDYADFCRLTQVVNPAATCPSQD